MEINKFTKKQLANWKAYEKVRKSGLYNMHYPRAFRASGLTTAEYDFVQDNYSEIKEAQKPRKIDWQKSALRLAGYIWDSHELDDFQNFIAEGHRPQDHVLWHAAVCLGRVDELPKAGTDD